jgi:DNA-directed RNA polymerase subunit alpha
MSTEPIELASYFEQPEITPEVFARYADAAHASATAREQFEALLGDYRTRAGSDALANLRAALGLLIVGRYGDALETFEHAPAGAMRHYHAAQAALNLAQHDRAVREFQQAGRHGWDAFEIDMQVAAVHVRAGDTAAAEKLVQKHEGGGPDRACWHFVRGLLADQRNDRAAALEAYEKCLTLNPTHTEGLFRCARVYDVCGLDRQALALYRRLTEQPRAYVNALLNAAVIYEDVGRYDDALVCVARVLRASPNHQRARLFYKDIESCREMVITEGHEPLVDPRVRLLKTPLSEFELSVRARNCLKKMNVRTVGELVKLTEAELMTYKNFGETTLSEIKGLLTKKGLQLGVVPEQFDESTLDTEFPERKTPPVPTGQDALLGKPVAEVELSVRARRCLQRLNVQTLGDLVQYSEADLLATRNFGATSLNEVKVRLTELGLQLAPKKAT